MRSATFRWHVHQPDESNRGRSRETWSERNSRRTGDARVRPFSQIYAQRVGRRLGSFLEALRALVVEPSIVPTGQPPTVPADDLPAGTDGKTVEAMLDNVRRLVAYEEQRLSSLTSRGSALLGLSGLATAVLGAAGSNAAFPLGSKVLFALSIVALVFTAAAIVLGMLAARGGTIQSTRQLELYRDPGYQRVSPARVQVQILDSLLRRLEGLREQNRRRAMWLNRGALSVAVAVLLAASAGVIRFFS